eukprot:5631072-Amphidinium_carterae.1
MLHISLSVQSNQRPSAESEIVAHSKGLVSRKTSLSSSVEVVTDRRFWRKVPKRLSVKWPTIQVVRLTQTSAHTARARFNLREVQSSTCGQEQVSNCGQEQSRVCKQARAGTGVRP